MEGRNLPEYLMDYFLNVESTPKSRIARHCEARSNLISLIICTLRLLHFVRNDEIPLFVADSMFEC